MHLLGIIEGVNGVKNYFAYGNDELIISKEDFPVGKMLENVKSSVKFDCYENFYDYEFYSDVYRCAGYKPLYLEDFLEKLEKTKAKLDIRGFDFTEKEMDIGIEYVKNSYPVSYDYIKDDITYENFEWLIECEWGDNFEYALKAGYGYLEGYTGVYGYNDLFELIDSYVAGAVNGACYENQELTTDYIKDCLNNAYGDPEYTWFSDKDDFGYEITDFINPTDYKRMKKYYSLKYRIADRLNDIERYQSKILDLRHNNVNNLNQERIQEITDRDIKKIPVFQDEIRECKQELKKFRKKRGSECYFL